jgi:hypothetical protein
MTGSLWPPEQPVQSREAAAAPALLPSGCLLAALALLLVAPPASAGWVAGAVVVRGGWVSRGRLAAAASVTGTLALLAVGPRWPLAASWVPWSPSALSCRPP